MLNRIDSDRAVKYNDSREALLLSRHALDAVPYNRNAAFTADEQAQILLTDVDNGTDRGGAGPGGRKDELLRSRRGRRTYPLTEGPLQEQTTGREKKFDMNKILRVLLAAVLIIALCLSLAGCSKSAGKTGSAKSAKTVLEKVWSDPFTTLDTGHATLSYPSSWFYEKKTNGTTVIHTFDTYAKAYVHVSETVPGVPADQLTDAFLTEICQTRAGTADGDVAVEFVEKDGVRCAIWSCRKSGGVSGFFCGLEYIKEEYGFSMECWVDAKDTPEDARALLDKLIEGLDLR